MTDRLPPLNALRAFEAAARHLSFKKAAAELFVTPAAVSQQVKALEDYLGVALFRRLTRALVLTGHGAAMLPQVTEGFDNLLAALATARRTEEGGRIAVNAPPNFTARWLLPRLTSFSAGYPQFDLRITGTLRAIDKPEQSLLAGLGRADAEAQVSVRYGTGDYPGALVDLLFRPVYVPVCSPRLLGRGPALRRPADLRFHTLIHDDSSPGDEERPGWEEWLRTTGTKGIDTTRGPRLSNASLVHEAARDGVGVALALRPLVDSDIEEGRLVVPFERAVPTHFGYFLVTPQALTDHPAVEAFRLWILGQAEKQARRR
ncbi:MAG TPA: transcriptional regulator GcvA [Usitatibacteraceae bacterium]|nr:transcriptional regulator GcvA [Usitatibacteraceae bacterium]